jgi:superfamily II DNA/RNA helicase
MRAALIFCNTKEGARFVFETLNSAKYKVALIEGEMSTHARSKSLDQLRRKEIQFLVATDVASRGIDIPHVTHIINFEVPLNRDSYIHRIGRTARHDGTGKAYTLCNLETDEKDILRIKEEISVKTYKEFDYNLKIKKK